MREEPEDSESYEKHSRREDESSKVDPRDVPDPESVAGWSDESIKGICSNLFVLPEENKSVTLNPCKQLMCVDVHLALWMLVVLWMLVLWMLVVVWMCCLVYYM